MNKCNTFQRYMITNELYYLCSALDYVDNCFTLYNGKTFALLCDVISDNPSNN